MTGIFAVHTMITSCRSYGHMTMGSQVFARIVSMYNTDSTDDNLTTLHTDLYCHVDN